MKMPATISPLQTDSTLDRLILELGLGILGGASVTTLGLMLSLWLPEVSPFALAYPLILIGTLYGHCAAGVIAGMICLGWGWWRVFQPGEGFIIDVDTGLSIVFVHSVSILVTLIFALAFRRAIRRALAERDEEIARGAMLMRELEHRTKNNFALVVSLLQAQTRHEADPKVAKALDLARARINSFARAYANLGENRGHSEYVTMSTYLDEVVSNFAKGGFPEQVTAEVHASDCQLPAEEAVGIGLFVNEALTNSAKHAFPDNRPGKVTVSLEGDGQHGWAVTIEDDGVGFSQTGEDSTPKKTGSRLLAAFAQQARATFTIDTSGTGTRLRLVRSSPDARH